MPKYGGNNRIDFGVHFNTDKSSLADVQKAFQKLQDIKPANFKGTKEELKQIKLEALKVLSALTSAFNVKLGSLNIEKFKAELKGLNLDKLYTDLSRLGTQGQVAFGKMATSMLTTNLQLKQTHSLINSMGTTMMNTVKWGIASKIMNGFTQSVSLAFQYVKSLDSALTDIRIVTGDSTLQMAKFADQANRAAQLLGRSTMDYSKAALKYYQQGLTDEEVQARTEATLKAQNITGAGLEMANYLTAVWNGYKVANEEAELYVDKLAAVADSSASNMALLATAMSKVASTANMLGVPVDSLNAQIATIVATTRQAPESVGNALKTIYARINDIATGADDAEISLGNYSSKMAELGINVLDSNGKLRDTGDVIELIGGKWEGLSREQQIYLARTMAGQRQYNNLLALFENWSKYTDLVNISMLSQGTTMLKNSRYMDSLAAHMEQLGAAGERVKSAMIDTDSFKGLVDVGTDLTNLFANLIESIGGGGTAFLALASIVTQVFGGIISREIANMINNMKLADENAQILARDIQMTQLFGKSQAYSDGVITTMVNAKKEAQQYYQVMSEGQINAYNGIVQQIGAALQLKFLLEKLTEKANELNSAFEKSFGKETATNFNILQDSFRDLKETFAGFSGSKGLLTLKDSIVFDQLKEQIKDFKAELGGLAKDTPALDNLEKIFNKVGDSANLSKSQLKLIRSELENLIGQAGGKIELVSQVDDLNHKLTQSKANLDQATLAKNQFLETTRTEAYTRQIVGMVSGVGRLASGFMALRNLVNVWSNDSLSAGEKVLQTFTNLGFVIPMIVTSIGSIRTGWAALTDLIITKAALINKLKVTETTLTGTVVAATTAETAAHKANTVALLQEAGARAIANGNGQAYLAICKLLEAFTGKQLIETQTLTGANAGLITSQSGVAGSALAETNALQGVTVAEGLATVGAMGLGNALKILAGHFSTVLIAGAAIGAIALTIYGIAKAYDAAENAAKKARELADKFKAGYSEIKKQVNDINSSFNQLKDAQTNLKGLTKGTELWKTALEDTNSQVLELCKNFPQLNKYLYTTSEGMLDFQDGAEKEIELIMDQASLGNALAYIHAEQRATLAENKSLITNASREDLDVSDFNLLNKVKLEDLLEAMEKQGNSVLDNSEELEKLGFTEKEIGRIQGLLKSKIILLRTEVTGNSNATKNLTNAILKSELEGTPLYENAQDKETFTSLVDIATRKQSESLISNFATYDGTGTDYNYNQIKKYLAEYFGLDEHSITHSGIVNGGKFKFTSNGQSYEYTAELAAKIAAEQKAASENFSLNVKNAANIMADLADKFKKDNTGAEAGSYELAKHVDEIKLGDYSNIDTSKFSQLSIKAIKEKSKEVGDSLGVEEKDVEKALDSISESIVVGLEDYKSTLSQSTQRVFEELHVVDSGKYSKEAATALGNILESALGDPKQYDFLKDVLKDVSPEDLPSLENLINTTDWETTSISEFQDALKGAGVLLNLTDDLLITFINIIKELKGLLSSPLAKYARIHLITDGLKRGDSITPEQQADLLAAGISLDGFFQKGKDGLLHLTTSAELFQKYVDQISLKNFEDEVNSLQLQIAQIQNFQSSEYGHIEGDTRTVADQNTERWNRFSQNSYGSGITGLDSAQVQFLQNQVELTEEEKKLVDDINNSKEHGKNLTAEQAEELSKIVQLHLQEWLNSSENLNGLKERLDEINGELSEGALDPDVDIELHAQLTEYLEQNAKYIEDFSDSLEEDKEAALEIAESILRMDSALLSLQENSELWERALNGSAEDMARVAPELRNAYADMFDINGAEALSNEFITSADNLRLMELAANGSTAAMDLLDQRITADLTAHPRMDLGEFNTSQDLLLNMISNINSQMNGIEVGARINNVGLLNDINDVLATCARTRDQAEAILSDMRVDGEVEQITVPKKSVTQANDVIADPTSTTEQIPIILPDGTVEYQDVNIPSFRYKVQPSESSTAEGSDMVTVWALKPGHNPTKAASPKLNYKHSTHGGGGKTSGSGSKGGGGGKKGGSSSAKPSIAKPSTTKIDTKKKLQKNDPYYKVNKSIEKQDKLLKQIQDKEKGLVNKDRLKNLQLQNKAIEKQLKYYRDREAISKNVAAENSTANLRKRLKDAFGGNISFDTQGYINDMNKVERAAVNSYNNAANKANNAFENVKKQYNNWILHTWNAHNKEWQDAHSKEKETWDERLKKAEENAKNAISAAEEEYKKKTLLIKDYEKALKEDEKIHEEYLKAISQKLENIFEASKIKVDLALDTGELERDWLEFENKFIKNISDDDILGNALMKFQEIDSYVNSLALEKTKNEIAEVSKQLQDIQAGGWAKGYELTAEDMAYMTKEEIETYRVSMEKDLQERLKDLQEQMQEDLMSMKELTDLIKESYLDMIDEAADRMSEHVDQYERINDLIEHNVKLTEMLYGDKGYDTLDKYYQLQKDNNYTLLQTLKEQEEYWRTQMNNEVVGSEAWKKFKENLDDAIEQVNSKMLDMLDNLAKEFENKINAAVDKINNRLTDNLGTDYLDEQWDYLNNYDDYFLDTYNSTTGIEDVTRAYQQAIDDAAANPKQQQRLNKLMNDQLKILKEKDKLTLYDLKRAKSMLEVEKARMALEDARNNKTKMRLRRDSQGNYTYQYVADEEKLGELQDALANAQNDLYNQDKEHYKENLNELYDTYKEYIEKMRDLTTEYNATLDEEERARIQKRIDLLNSSYSEMMDGLTEDNKYNIQYLIESFGSGMHIDFSGLSEDEQWQVLKENVPWAQSNIQNLADSIVGEGGLIPATKNMVKELGKAIQEYDDDVKQILNTGGTSLENVEQAVDAQGKALDNNITDAQEMISYTKELVNSTKQGVVEMQNLLDTLDNYWNEQMEHIQEYVKVLQEGYNTAQQLNGSTLTADNVDFNYTPASTTEGNTGVQFTGNLAQDTQTLTNMLNSAVQQYYEFLAAMSSASFDSGGYTGIWGGDDGKLALLHQKELVLNPTDTENILAAVTAVRDATASMNIQSLLDNLNANTSSLLRNLIENSTLFDQNVHIDANFPNVNNHTLIEEAFNNLVNMAAMRASGYKD